MILESDMGKADRPAGRRFRSGGGCDMRTLVTGKQMKSIDSWTIETVGIPSLVLMERAALSVAREVEDRAGKKERIWCAC